MPSKVFKTVFEERLEDVLKNISNKEDINSRMLGYLCCALDMNIITTNEFTEYVIDVQNKLYYGGQIND